MSQRPTSSLAACVWIPLFPLRCEEARHEGLASHPTALLAPDTTRKLWQVSPLARHAGVKPGMTVSQAIGLCPTLRLIEPDPVQFSGLDYRADFIQSREQTGEALVVVDRIGFDQSQRGAETDRLADGHPGLHACMARERGDLPELPRRIGGEQRRRVGCESLMTRLFTAEREEGNPNAGGERARWTLRH